MPSLSALPGEVVQDWLLPRLTLQGCIALGATCKRLHALVRDAPEDVFQQAAAGHYPQLHPIQRAADVRGCAPCQVTLWASIAEC